MTPRMQMPKVIPEGYRAVLALDGYVKGKLDPTLFELVKLRASMVNGCAFCVDMHTTEALDGGDDLRRIVGVAAWRESPFFTTAERVALALTDELTRLTEHGVSDETWDRTVKEFGEETTADLILAISTINVWNRVAMSSRAAPPPLTS